MSSRALDDPVLERRRLAALAQIRQFGDPVLRMRAGEVTAFDRGLDEDVELMTRIMIDGRGVGLAAPQIGRSRRLIVVRPDEDGPTITLCNPRIASRSEEEEIDAEGCLSLGEISVDVPRALELRVEAQDGRGQEIELEVSGFQARVLQHEIDHLDGVLIIDRCEPEQRKRALRELRELTSAIG
jgi:peptide deformylase